MLEREAVTARVDDRVTLRLFCSGEISSLSSSSAELFEDDSVSSSSSRVPLVSEFSIAFGRCRVPLGTIANGSGSAISSRPLFSIWRIRFLVITGFVRGYERFFPMTETGVNFDEGAESESEDVRVRRDEEPSSAVVSVDNRLGILTAEDPEVKGTRRLGRGRKLRDPKGWRGVRKVILNSSSSS